ncbi:hypothetical protein [Bradyrhizobium japonicum]|uniref:hypothetical protein n=1 Tax=Bradyrhizobium japonicum TaxID=375 RepID=UPI000422A19C|nr:hypothetical protein [Bradyrhizobium japonicum]
MRLAARQNIPDLRDVLGGERLLQQKLSLHAFRCAFCTLACEVGGRAQSFSQRNGLLESPAPFLWLIFHKTRVRVADEGGL